MVMKLTGARLAAMALLLLAAPLPVAAQPAGKMYAVGILGEKASDPSEARMWQTFQLGLRELGWIEGRNIRIESRWVEDNYARLPELAADLVRLKMDLIVTRGSTYAQGAVAGGRGAGRGGAGERLHGDRPRRSAGRFRALLGGLQCRETAYGRVGHSAPAPNDVRRQGPRGGGWPHELRRGFRRSLPARCHLCGQNPQRREACRSPGRTTHEVRVCDQRQDGESPRPDDPPASPAASGPGD